MQTLSTLPSMGESWMIPQLSFELGSSLKTYSSGRRKKIWDLGFPVTHGRSSGLLLLSSTFTVAGCGRPKCDLGCGFLSGYSKIRVARFCKPKKSCLGALVASEEQVIANEFLKEESSSEDRVVENLDDVEVGDNNDDDNADQQDKKTEDFSGEEGGEGESGRIDVRALAWSLRLAKTADDVEDILKDKGELPLQVYSTMIKGFGRDKIFDSAFALVKWLKRKKEETNGFIAPNLFIYNSLLGALKQSEQYGEMEKVLNDMAEEGVLPNIVTYNTMMAIYVEQGRATKALNVFEEIQMKGLTPSPVSYSTALLAYRRMEDGNGALKFFIEIREKYDKGEIGKDADEDWENEFVKLENFTIRVCYQVMRSWLVKDDDLSIKVLKLLIEMDNAGVPLGQSEHERLMWACTREEHHIVAKELYNRIRERHSEIRLSVCNHVIWLMGKAKKWWTALEIYEDLLDKGPKPNNMSYELVVSHFNTLLTAARRRGIWKWGVRLLNKMEEKGLKPGSKEWNSVLIACSKASQTSAAVQIFRRMVEQGQKPTIISYGALLSALEKGKLYDEARRVWEHMLKVGVKPNVYAYTIMASVFAGQGKFNMVDIVIHEMVSSGIEPTVVTYNAIISGCAGNGMSTAAYEWFNRMKVQNVSHNEVTYEVLIEALAKDSKPRLAYELYLRAQNEGLRLSSKAYDTVIESSQVYGATIDVKLLGARPRDKKEKVQKKEN
ncbi:protein LOW PHOTOSYNTHETIC EFFICIENCY 1, chloroplastic [Ziziphus jujuba]|uniref:Protein LOW PHOTOSYNTHETIC EFFICIENCY 1, chloroplastic n=1 Tax=Ziziphus jujuba TaxID=326968 RepID=A0ABM3IGY1_ZIZJJ|nr:protein LOW PHOTOSYNTHETIC EFFICIENCY 1, chloroplastic [Ziziphus jujuba]